MTSSVCVEGVPRGQKSQEWSTPESSTTEMKPIWNSRFFSPHAFFMESRLTIQVEVFRLPIDDTLVCDRFLWVPFFPDAALGDRGICSQRVGSEDHSAYGLR
jgi:hypothetical protein